MPTKPTERAEPRERTRIRRRPLLGSLSALGILSSVGASIGPTTGVGRAVPDGDWEDAADERIEEHRTADLEVTVTDGDGTELDGAEVSVTMQEHEYGFGTMVDAEFLTDGTEWGEPMEAFDGTEFDEEDHQEYEETVEELFNTIVLENLHKWGMWEDNQGIADAAVDWTVDRNMNVRGHVALWGNVGAHAIPPDVVEAMGVEWEDGGATDPDHDPEYVRERAMDHIEEIITHYGEDIQEWEVKNEVVHVPEMINAVEGDGADDDSVDPVEADVLGDWYEHAEEIADDEGVDVAVNDYNTLEGAYEDTRDEYERQIDYLVNERGIDLDGIGFQTHFSDEERLEPDEILEGLERFEGYGAGFRATEFDTFQGDWESSEEQGEYLYEFLKTFFSHPDTDAFLVWGHWDGVHWAPDFDGSEPDGVLFDQDWNPKPAYDYYTDLVFEEWWTDDSGETEGGTYATTGFKGEYEITARHDGAETTTTATLSDGGETVELQLEPEDDGAADDSTPGLGIGSALAGLSVAGYAILRGDDESTT